MKPEREWMWKRKFLGRSLRSLHKRLNHFSHSDVVTVSERNRIIQSEGLIKSILFEWNSKNESSKRQYLKQKER